MDPNAVWEEQRQAHLITLGNEGYGQQPSTITSLEVAEMLEVQHWEVIRKLEGSTDRKGYIEILNNNQMVVVDYFEKSTYKDTKGEERPCYLFTKMGCEFIGNKFTGEKGILFTAKYVKRFNDMETVIQQPLKLLSPTELLKVQLQAMEEQDRKIENVDIRVEKLENTMTIDYSQQEQLNLLARTIVVQALGGKGTPAYKELNKKAFSQLWRDYKRVMHVNSYKNTAVKEFEKGRDLILNWKAPRELELMITGANSQMRVEAT